MLPLGDVEANGAERATHVIDLSIDRLDNKRYERSLTTHDNSRTLTLRRHFDRHLAFADRLRKRCYTCTLRTKQKGEKDGLNVRQALCDLRGALRDDLLDPRLCILRIK